MEVSERLIEATPFLLQNWLPFNQPLLTSLKQSSVDNLVSTDGEAILNSIRKDPALYTYCLLLASDSTASDDQPMGSSISAKVLTGLKKFFGTQRHTLPAHHLQSASKRQRELLRNSLTRTTASTIIAPYFNVDGESAYVSNSLREIGIALIAWNYPRIFNQAEEHVRSTGSPLVDRSKAVDSRLGELLGFHPLQLAVSLAKRLQLAPEVLIGIGAPQSAQISNQALAIGSTLRKVAEISEVFALATNPETSQELNARWDLYREELLPLLGTPGLTRLRETCVTVLNSYAETLPELAAQPIPEKLCRGPEKNHTQRYLQNFQIPHCSNEVQELLRQLYSKINPAVIAYENVTQLIKKIAPKAGFEHGIVYLINPNSYSLESRLALGTPKEKNTTIYYRQKEFHQHPVVAAYTGKLPVVECHQDGQLVAIAGILGDTQRVGVLYLEPYAPNETNRPTAFRAHFKAIQQTLNDCLNLC